MIALSLPGCPKGVQGGTIAGRNVAPIGLTPYYPILLKETGDKSKDSHLFFSFAGNLLDLSKT